MSPRTARAPRRILITGANSGLGLALTKQFLGAGDTVIGTDIHSEPSGELAALVAAGRAQYLRLDVRNDADWERARAHVADEGLDVLVNNAGVAIGGRIDRVPMDDWQWIIDINLLGVVRGCRTFTPLFKAQGRGHIVNIASAAGLVHAPGMSAYNTVKAGVVALSETLHFELEPHGITVSVVCPTFFRTNLGDSMRRSDPTMEDSGQKLIAEAPYSADTIAAAVRRDVDRGTFLITPDAMARFAHAAKRHAWPLYRREMRTAGRKLRSSEETGGEVDAMPGGVAAVLERVARRRDADHSDVDKG